VADLIVKDQASTTAMVLQFDQAQDACRTIDGKVGSMASFLGAAWTGDADGAAARFQQSIAKWQQGFKKVQEGLAMLDTTMVDFSNKTNTQEDNLALQATNWANPIPF
jgi:uncharacterized protein YukE